MSRSRRDNFRLEMPALRFGDQKVAEHLHPRDGLEFFRINEIGVERDGVGLAEQLHQPAILLDQVVRQQGDADAALACAQNAEHVVDGQRRGARTLAVARNLDQPAPVLPPNSKMRWLSRSSSVRGVPYRLMYSGEA